MKIFSLDNDYLQDDELCENAKVAKQLTPQEKKELSYKLDRRNSYGNSPQAARKCIPFRKAKRNRANRRYSNQCLSPTKGNINQELAEDIESRLKHRVPNNWKKWSDAPLGEVVAENIERRKRIQTIGEKQALLKIRFAERKFEENEASTSVENQNE